MEKKEFRLPRKTKKRFKYYRSDTSKKNWRQYYVKHYSWKEYIKRMTFSYYSYNQEGWDKYNSDKTKNFECECCGNSVFKYGGYPNYHKEYKDLMCDDCYDDEFRTSCPVCEDKWENEDMTEHFFITKDISGTVGKEPGLYKILRYPFYYGDCVTGFDAFFDNALEKVSNMDISKVGKLIGRDYDDVKLDCICPDCLEKYSRSKSFVEVDKNYSILRKNASKDSFFKEYTPEALHRARVKIINQKINFKGILQSMNCVTSIN